MVAMHSMQSKLAVRPFQFTVNDWSQSVPQVMHTDIKRAVPVKGFQVLLIADPGHTLGGSRRNLFQQKSFSRSDQVLWPVGAASRWCPDGFGGMVGYSVQMARLLRPKRQQLRATCAACGRGPDQGTAVWMP